MRYRRNTEETNFWAGYADCMLALFMVALLLWILSSGKTAFSSAESEAKRTALNKDIEELKSDLEKKKKELKRVQDELKKLKGEVAKRTDWFKKYEEERLKFEKAMDELQQLKKEKRDIAELLVKITDLERELRELRETNTKLIKESEKVFVEVSGTDVYTFASGKALIDLDFGDALAGNQFADLAERIIDRHLGNNNINDVLEIIGHTDGTRWSAGPGNLDAKLPLFLSGKDPNVKKLKAGSNNDLGLLRALAIRNAWGNFVEDYADAIGKGILLGIKVRCYSAGQTLPAEGIGLEKPDTYTQNNPAFRRIEIRLTNVGENMK